MGHVQRRHRSKLGGMGSALDGSFAAIESAFLPANLCESPIHIGSHLNQLARLALTTKFAV